MGHESANIAPRAPESFRHAGRINSQPIYTRKES
jgi:hypothetical protein